ncbi:MAG: DUF6056 family protein [Gammaproteobacteria bacterium]|jgi:hypothetical protein
MHKVSQRTSLTILARIAPYLLIAASLAVLLVYILPGQYAHPSSDDFCMAAGVNEQGLATHLWNHYLEWSGRYTSNALYAIYPLLFDLFDGYKFIPLIVILGLLLATAYFLSNLFATRLFARPVLLSSLCFVSVYLLGMLSPASSLYWMAGAFTYQTANIFFLVALGMMIQLSDRQKRSQNYFGLSVVLLLVVIIAVGTNETSMLALTALVLLGFLMHLRSGWVVIRPWLAIAVVALACFGIVYFSPGNAVRADDFPLRHDLARAITGSLSIGFKTLWIWISNPVLIVSGLLAPFAISRLYLMSGRFLSVSGPLIAALVLCTFALPVMLQFPAWWSMGGWPPARTLDAIYFLFLIGWFSSIGALTIRYLCQGKWNGVLNQHHPYAAFALLILSGLFTLVVLQSNAYRLAREDLFSVARPYHEYLNRRYDQIEAAVASGQRNLVVPDYRQKYPRSIFFNDIMQNPDHWRNVCYAGYFGLEKIKRQGGERGLDRREPPGKRRVTSHRFR